MGALISFFSGTREPGRERQREGHNVPGHEGEVEREERDVYEVGREAMVEERERGIGPQANEPDIQQQPAGHTEYSLSPELESNPIQAQVQITESFLEPAKDHFREIDERYNEALEKRKEIDTLLKQFKEKLGLQADVNFPACFKQLRKQVGKYETLELSEDTDEPLQIILGEEADGNTQEAVEIFNSMLQKCREFPAEVEAATAYIKAKIQAAESECLQTQKTRMGLETSKASCDQIHAFGQEITKLVKDVKLARSYLLPMVTGMLLRLN